MTANLEQWYPALGTGKNEFGVVKGSPNSGRWVIHPSTRLDMEDAGLIAATHNARLDQPYGVFLLESLVASQTGEPRVQLTIDHHVAQMSVRQARSLVDNLQGVIEAAMTDAFIAGFFRQRIFTGQEDEAAMRATAGVLMEFRSFRDEMTGKNVTEVEGQQ